MVHEFTYLHTVNMNILYIHRYIISSQVDCQIARVLQAVCALGLRGSVHT